VFGIRLQGDQTVRDVLEHLYVLLPVLDNSKHYYVEQSEIDKLLDHGGTWLALHPERDLIARRYLRYKRPLISSLLQRLAELDAPIDGEIAPDADAAQEEEAGAASAAEPVPGLHEQRLQEVLAAIREIEATSLLDLGCGEGRLLQLALKDRQLTRILGMDVSSQALARARRRVHWDTMPPLQKKRVDIVLGSLLYRDQRLAGFDAAALVEVIEHLDAARLRAMERVVFRHARPRRIIVTTPNHEYNVHWAQLGADRMRHKDHRFEWTREECRKWAEQMANTYGYRFTFRGIGPEAADIGAPSHMVIFDLKDIL
jgi:3' terminal RNA ribose 2'-O-methyltransferase Hen1